jgi:hypothetical protein
MKLKPTAPVRAAPPSPGVADTAVDQGLAPRRRTETELDDDVLVDSRARADRQRRVAGVVADAQAHRELLPGLDLRQPRHRSRHGDAAVGDLGDVSDHLMELADVRRIARQDAWRHVGDASAARRLAVAQRDLVVVDRSVGIGRVLHAAGLARVRRCLQLRDVGGVAVGRARGHTRDLAELVVGRIAHGHRGLRAGGRRNGRLLVCRCAARYEAGHACSPGSHRACTQCHAAALLHHRTETDGRALGDVPGLAQLSAACVGPIAERRTAAACAGILADGLRAGGQ